VQIQAGICTSCLRAFAREQNACHADVDPAVTLKNADGGAGGVGAPLHCAFLLVRKVPRRPVIGGNAI
jgi:hypothetical protein